MASELIINFKGYQLKNNENVKMQRFLNMYVHP